MTVVNDLYYWTGRVLAWGLIALYAWAFLDCLTRKAAAFPAVDKLSKLAWLGILAFCLVIGGIIVNASGLAGGGAIVVLGAAIGASVYLADVRPAVREASGGSRW